MGWDHYLSARSGAIKRATFKLKDSDRLFSLSSITSQVYIFQLPTPSYLQCIYRIMNTNMPTLTVTLTIHVSIIFYLSVNLTDLPVAMNTTIIHTPISTISMDERPAKH